MAVKSSRPAPAPVAIGIDPAEARRVSARKACRDYQTRQREAASIAADARLEQQIRDLVRHELESANGSHP